MAKRPSIGRLKHRVTIQRRAETIDTDFGLTDSQWTNVRSVAAEVRSLRGRELEIARQRVSDASLIVTIRHVAGLKTTDRLIFRDRILNIGSAVDPDEAGRFLEILATEQT